MIICIGSLLHIIHKKYIISFNASTVLLRDFPSPTLYEDTGWERWSHLPETIQANQWKANGLWSNCKSTDLLFEQIHSFLMGILAACMRIGAFEKWTMSSKGLSHVKHFCDINCNLIRFFGDGGILSLMISEGEKERVLMFILNYMPDLLISIN